jgi:hypothetical protein
MAIFFCRAEVKTSDGSYWWTFTATILTMVVLLLFGFDGKEFKDLSLEKIKVKLI